MKAHGALGAVESLVSTAGQRGKRGQLLGNILSPRPLPAPWLLAQSARDEGKVSYLV